MERRVGLSVRGGWMMGKRQNLRYGLRATGLYVKHVYIYIYIYI